MLPENLISQQPAATPVISKHQAHKLLHCTPRLQSSFQGLRL